MVPVQSVVTVKFPVRLGVLGASVWPVVNLGAQLIIISSVSTETDRPSDQNPINVFTECELPRSHISCICRAFGRCLIALRGCVENLCGNYCGMLRVAQETDSFARFSTQNKTFPVREVYMGC